MFSVGSFDLSNRWELTFRPLHRFRNLAATNLLFSQLLLNLLFGAHDRGEISGPTVHILTELRNTVAWSDIESSRIRLLRPILCRRIHSGRERPFSLIVGRYRSDQILPPLVNDGPRLLKMIHLSLDVLLNYFVSFYEVIQFLLKLQILIWQDFAVVLKCF